MKYFLRRWCCLILDIDECFFSFYDCYVDGYCNNIEGLYYCICDNGYMGNGVLCIGKSY